MMHVYCYLEDNSAFSSIACKKMRCFYGIIVQRENSMRNEKPLDFNLLESRNIASNEIFH